MGLYFSVGYELKNRSYTYKINGTPTAALIIAKGGSHMEAKDIEFFRTFLNQMLDDILRKGEETIEDMTETREVYADPADRATAESDRSFTLRLRDRERKLIKKVQQALQRIDDGSFGECEECGDDIGVERLKARPVTTLCINCKSKQEEEEKVRGD